jgi:hypothetical protein
VRHRVPSHFNWTLPNCQQLTPSIALSVVPTMIGYSLVLKIFRLNCTMCKGSVTLATMAVGKHTHPVKNGLTSYFPEVKYMCCSTQIANYSKLLYCLTRKRKHDSTSFQCVLTGMYRLLVTINFNRICRALTTPKVNYNLHSQHL